MKRPNIEEAEEIYANLDEIVELQSSLVSRTHLLQSQVRNSGLEIQDREQLVELMTYLYWWASDVEVRSIATALGTNKSLKKILPSVKSGFRCNRCEEEIMLESRSHAKNISADLQKEIRSGRIQQRKDFKIFCKKCEKLKRGGL